MITLEPSVDSAHEVAPILYHRGIRGYSARRCDRLTNFFGSSNNATGDDRVWAGWAGIWCGGWSRAARGDCIRLERRAVTAHVTKGVNAAKDLADVARLDRCGT